MLAALSVSLFTMSLLYFNNSVILNAFFKNTQMTIYFILGFLHAYTIYRLKNIISNGNVPIFFLICDTFIYTAWYNVILLPESGIGFLEWGFVFFVLLMNFANSSLIKKAQFIFASQNPISLILFGFLLYIAKSFLFYITSSNIYDTNFLGNTTAKIFLISVILICMAMGIKISINKTRINKDIKIDNDKKSLIIKKALKGSSAVIKNIIATIFTTFGVPVIITIIAAILIYLIFFASAVINDIENFFQPFLEKILTTGENTIKPSAPYGALQFTVFMSVVFYTVYINNQLLKMMQQQLKTNIKDALCENIYTNITGEKFTNDTHKRLNCNNISASQKSADIELAISQSITSDTTRDINNNDEDEKTFVYENAQLTKVPTGDS